MDLFLDMRDRKQERKEIQDAWNEIKKGVLKNQPHTVAYGQSRMKTKIFLIMGEQT